MPWNFVLDERADGIVTYEEDCGANARQPRCQCDERTVNQVGPGALLSVSTEAVATLSPTACALWGCEPKRAHREKQELDNALCIAAPEKSGVPSSPRHHGQWSSLRASAMDAGRAVAGVARSHVCHSDSSCAAVLP